MGREQFEQRIEKGLFGPGSDHWGLTDAEEIISDYPLVRYFTGVLFPEKEPPKRFSEEDELLTRQETEEPNRVSLEEQELIEQRSEGKENKEFGEEVNGRGSQSNFFPNNIGITFCVEKDATSLEVEFSGGFYYEPAVSEVKIKVPQACYDAFTNPSLGFPFKDILQYEDGFLSLSRPLQGDKGGKNKRSGEFLFLDEFRQTDVFKDSSAKEYIPYFDRLIGRTWKRQYFNCPSTLPIKDTPAQVPLPVEGKAHKEFSLAYYMKTYEVKGNKYVKVQLINASKKQASKRFTNKTQELNQKCLFQAQIKVSSSKILPYKDRYDLTPFDREAEELNFLYRHVKSYCVGHNCSASWNVDHTELYTTFLPSYNVRETKNNFTEEDFTDPEDYHLLTQALDIKRLSVFSDLGKEAVLQNLEQFVRLYERWVKGQQQESEALDSRERTIGDDIVKRLEGNLLRLQEGLACLRDEEVFRAFQLGNTAMLLQLIISNDTSFTKTEKEVNEITNGGIYNDLKFFRDYDYSRLAFPIRYRPFQLAFLLLNIKGIIDPLSRDRRDVVDLIWFPTGGGKTEAYLAVSAFTIIYRRLMNTALQGSGVSVIMRYTLRLLTAQQFERSSKLIASLEFLRRHFSEELKGDPITIGLWVGNQLTPGTIEDATKAVEEIESEFGKKEGRPANKNIFQISACPWCGTKLISIDDYGFTAEPKNFKIRCINRHCAFHQQIPVQVVDEMLFKKPPTLLFATVDKFAQVAWKEEAHRFFNSLNKDKLPPDLIIQDELHLLTGPLGSIVGLFESVVEQLCTREEAGLMPKIIASTATTRNTKAQVAQLYGNRSVNVFPPTGLSYSDSFFAKEAKQASRRKYIGFMPSGKTAVDAQLQLLAHLLEARIECGEPIDDHYWTIVSYYNALKDVGKIRNKIGDEVQVNTAILQSRLRGKNNPYKYNHYGLEGRTEELTARVDSSRIKAVLKQLEKKFESVQGIYKNVKPGVIDLVLATNMFSVGIDISRLNLMLINGMPKNIAEYIQASSRVGRKVEGLVLTLLDPQRARDKSYFEHFVPFHQAFYKSIEPISVTPFTENTIDKMLATLMIAFMRHKMPSLNKDADAANFKKEDIEELTSYLKARFQGYAKAYSYFEAKINTLAEDWEERANNGIKYSQLMKRATQVGVEEQDHWTVMQSMREVDTETYIQIKETFTQYFSKTSHTELHAES